MTLPLTYGETAARKLSQQLELMYLPVSLHSLRECDANGDVGDTAAGAGVLSSNTTPIMRGASGLLHQEISWATGNADPVVFQVALPGDFDGTKDVTLELWVSSGTTNAATMAVGSSWDGGATVTDSASDAGTLSATRHKITATIAAADIPDSARSVTFVLTPPTHATNAIQLDNVCLLAKRKLS